MRISVQKSLLVQALNSVNGAASKGTDPYDLGQYLMAVADKEAKTLSFTVAGKEILARSILGIGMVTEGVMNIQESGKFTFDGSPLIHSLSTHDIETTAELHLEGAKPKRKSAGPETPVDAAPPTIETLILTLPSGQGDAEEYGMQCIDLFDDPELSQTGKLVKIGARDFVKAIKQVEIAAGKPTLSTDFCNVRIRVRGGKMELATTNSRQIAIAKITASESPAEDIEIVLCHDTVKKVVKLLDESQDLSIYIGTKGENKQVVLVQDIVYANGVVGKTSFKISEPGYAFPDFDAHVAAVDFRFIYKMRLQALKKLCAKIEAVDTRRTQFSFDPEKKIAKIEKNKGGFAKTSIPLDAASDRLEIPISDQYISDAASVLEEEEVEMAFSGRTGLAKISSGPSFVMYFAPFQEE